MVQVKIRHCNLKVIQMTNLHVEDTSVSSPVMDSIVKSAVTG